MQVVPSPCNLADKLILAAQESEWFATKGFVLGKTTWQAVIHAGSQDVQMGMIRTPQLGLFTDVHLRMFDAWNAIELPVAPVHEPLLLPWFTECFELLWVGKTAYGGTKCWGRK